MGEMPTWNEVESVIEPLAVEYLSSVQYNFKDEAEEVSEIGESEDISGKTWDITIEIDGTTKVVSFSVVDSKEYEGEMLGYNISVKAVQMDGKILTENTPYNYTEDVWVTDIKELEARTKNIPILTPNDI